MALKLLAVGDIHLGRRPARLPDELAREAAELGPAGAWRRLVERAVAEEVDAVALAGDVVERAEDFYEAYRELRDGVQRLAEAGIRVLGVAGNHDVHVLPRLAEQLDDFELIGRGGEWQTRTLEAGGEQATIHGWSFREARVLSSPVAEHDFRRGPGVNLGLLHCDLDQRGSSHAPVMASELRGNELDGWLLGHIHVPHELDADNPRGYLGSVTGLDPGEPGDHGPWLVSVDGGRIRALEQWVLAPLRWEPLALDVTGLENAEDAHARLIDKLRARDRALAGATEVPKAVGVRLSLTGRSDLAREIEAQFEAERLRILVAGETTGAHWFIETVYSVTEPEIPLHQLAERSDPPGLLARRLLHLQTPHTEAAQRLIADGRKRLQQLRSESRWQPLDPESLEDEEVVDWLHRAGTRMLADMLAQPEADA